MPYQSILTSQQIKGNPPGVRKMIQEAPLSEKIETLGYHLKEAQTTIDFTNKSTNAAANSSNKLI